jgi:vacuolar-type H+-ATPase subunit H
VSDTQLGGRQPAERPPTDRLSEGAPGSPIDTAKESGQRVAATAKQQGHDVVRETQQQARDLGRQVGQQVDEQSRAQKDKAVGGLRALAEELGSMAANGGRGGVATDAARQASGATHGVADWLDQRDPGALLDELRDLARRRPGAFLVGALAAGAVAGRLTRGTVDASRSEQSDAQADEGAAAPDVDLTVPTGPGDPVLEPTYTATREGF